MGADFVGEMRAITPTVKNLNVWLTPHDDTSLRSHKNYKNSTNSCEKCAAVRTVLL